MKKFSTALGFFALSSCVLASTDWDLAQEKKMRCSEGNMTEMNYCLAREYTESKSHLSAVYKKLIGALLNPKPLKKSQAAWVRFRELECDFRIPSNSEGSGVPYSQNACLINITERRIQDLENITPCNGCVEFKDEVYESDTPYRHPRRKK